MSGSAEFVLASAIEAQAVNATMPKRIPRFNVVAVLLMCNS
ncbi:hypothetical protein QLH51_11270 [Sphingomonas sp. 2R-10]|nr:hypothetical protein [Sphingomonas sp. 2R-10]MDJ0277375.1 hypothetical protein [Sphingomonas sp. 2R-10]